jgi:hypothetical protein
MNIRQEIQPWIMDALCGNGGRGSITEVARHIWLHHERELRSSEEIFYNWQYDLRWAAGELRKIGRLKAATVSPRGVWELVPNQHAAAIGV